MKRSLKNSSLRIFALAVCTVPATVATLSCFPVWKTRSSGALLCGFTVLLLLVCAYPLVKAVKRFFNAPSVFTVWLLLFLGFMLVQSIAYEMTVISFVGMVSNLAGAFLFKLSRRGVNNEKLS